MAVSIHRVLRYLLMPEDTSCAVDSCVLPMPARVMKVIFWLAVSVLTGLGLDRLF